jgi:hypothetical protein
MLSELKSSRRNFPQTAFLTIGLSLCASCVSTVALDRAVIAYDPTVAESVHKQLLLNIARARTNQPMHFTAISFISCIRLTRVMHFIEVFHKNLRTLPCILNTPLPAFTTGSSLPGESGFESRCSESIVQPKPSA